MNLDLTLTIGEIVEEVNVVAHAELLKKADASLGEVVENKSIQELPLNRRMLLDLAVTVPGAHQFRGRHVPRQLRADAKRHGRSKHEHDRQHGLGAYGALYFNVQGYSGMGDTFLATPMHAYDTERYRARLRNRCDN